MANHRIQKNREKQNQDISEEIDPQIADALQTLPKEKKNAILQALSVSKHYSGPLPDSETIRVYSEVIPNGGDRLMTNVERQLQHRIEMENIGLKRTFNQSSTGQWMAFIIAIVFGLIAWHLGMNGHENVAMLLGSIDLVALVTVFITGRLSNK